MVNRYKTVLSLLLVVLVACAVVTVTGVVDINKLAAKLHSENDVTEGETLPPEISYEDENTAFTSAGLPFMRTDIENVFYTMDKNTGEVRFYDVRNKEVKELQETGKLSLTVSCSGEQLPAEMHYITVGDKTVGYGLFTNKLYSGVELYSYAFFKMTDQFPAYASESEYLLLADLDKNRIYSDNKVYSESFYLDVDFPEDEESEIEIDIDTFLNEDQRISDLHAVLRKDYKMFTDSTLDQPQDIVYFFSSRNYNDYEYSNTVDIFTTGGYGENVDNNRYIIDVASLEFRRTEDGTLYFEDVTIENENGEEEVTGFNLVLFDGEETKTVKEFTGSLENDYILTDDWLFEKASGKLYNIVTNAEKELYYSEFDVTFTVDQFDISPNGKYCIVKGRNNLNKPSVAYKDLESGEVIVYTDNIFMYVHSLYVLDDKTTLLNIITEGDEKSNSYYQLIGINRD